MTAAPTLLHPTSRRRDLLACALLTCLAAIWFWTLAFPFFQADDSYFVFENTHITRGLSAETITWAFTTTQPDYWHPLTWLSLALDSTLLGTSPHGYHFTNILLHLANTLLLYTFLRQLSGSVGKSLLAAAIFCIHPQRIESVAWITERKDVLAAFFGLLAFLTYVRYARRPTNVTYLLTALCFALSLMSKPLLVMFPFLLLLLDFWPLNRLAPIEQPSRDPRSSASIRGHLRPLLREKIPLFALAAASALNTLTSTTSSGLVRGSVSNSLLQALGNYAFYLRDMFYFGNLCFFPRAENSITPTLALTSALLLLAITASASLLARLHSSARPILVGWLWFLIALLPTSGLLQAGYSMRGDRFTYIPALGLIIALIFGLAPRMKLLTRKPIALTAAIVLVAVLTAFMLQRLALWKDPLTLLEHDLTLDPTNAYLEEYAGWAASRRGLEDRAQQHFYRASQLDPKEFPSAERSTNR